MADANAESVQQKIQIARRDAEALKDRIKRKKDELADTTCKCERFGLYLDEAGRNRPSLC